MSRSQLAGPAAILIALLAILLAFTTVHDPTLAPLRSLNISLTARPLTRLTNLVRNMATTTTSTTTTNGTAPRPNRTPVYFVSHGGPTTMYETSHPVYAKLQSLGREIREQVKPSAIVVFSAHWQSDVPGAVQVNTAEAEPLLYDFYGFPRHYYAEKFPHVGSATWGRKVVEALKAEGVRAEETERGLDHGVFVPFKVMFGEEGLGREIPVVQVSLLADERDAAGHIALGRAVEGLREQGVCVVVSGMAVHNLRDFMRSGGRSGAGGLPYAESFDGALREAVETEPGKERDAAMVGLLKRPDARLAHPTFEHLLPAHIGVGAAGSDQGKQLWTLPEGSMSWAQYRWGEVEA